jgi:hypothetical protein
MPPKFEEATLKKFILALESHKTVESIQMMNYLMNRKTPKIIDLTYEQYENSSHQGLGTVVDPDNTLNSEY